MSKQYIIPKALAFAFPLLITSQALCAAESFDTLCSKPGVIMCLGFDSTEEVNNENNLPGTSTTPSLDTAIKASGAGSIRFTIPTNSSAAAAGGYAAQFTKTFGPGTTLYLYWKQRFDENILNTDFMATDGNLTSFKQVVVHPNDSSCHTLEAAIVNHASKEYPYIYKACGAGDTRVDLENGDFLFQQGDYECHYRSENNTPSNQYKRPSCSEFVANQWMSFYVQITLGNWGENNSQVYAWVAYPGDSFKKFIDRPAFRFDSGGASGFQQARLSPYMTEKSADHVHPTAYTWYDDFIVAEQPIVDLGQTTSLTAPENLRAR